MSKRKSRKQRSRPNLPEETLARARRQAGIEDSPQQEVEAEVEADESEVEEAVVEAAAPAPRRRETLPPIERRTPRRREAKVSELSQAEIADRLSHPTRDVSKEELAAQYTYVIADLRSMGLLAGLLFIVMIVGARFL